MDKQKIENSVSEMLNSINYHFESPSVDVVSIAKRLGFVIGIAELSNDDDGFIVVQDGANEILGVKTDKLIGVNADRTPQWKRFIIAHEIGHYILDYKGKNLKGLYAHRDHERGHSNEENEIDYFAAVLLMPSTIFADSYRIIKQLKIDKQTRVKLLADLFEVTERMAERRIGELSLQ